MSANPRRTPAAPVVSLPADVRRALRSIKDDLRNLPRDCIHDRAELVHWLARMARRVEGVEQIQVPAAAPVPRTAPPPCHAATVGEIEKVFGRPATASKRPSRRTVTSRSGKSVQVETKARPLQLTLFGTGPG